MNMTAISTYHLFDIFTIVIGGVAWFFLWFHAKKTKSDQLRNYIPTLWTSLGILFTFIAIYFSLSGYTTETELDIAKLIGSVIPAFTTSIIGIVGAILSTLLNKMSIANAENKNSEEFQNYQCEIINRSGKKIKSMSPELMLLEIVDSISEQGKSICSKFDTIEHTSSDNTKAIISNLTNICCLIDKLNTQTNRSIATIFENQSKQFADTLEKTHTLFEQSLLSQQAMMSTKMDDMRRILHDDIQNIEQTNSNLLGKLVDQEKELLNITMHSLFDESKHRNEELTSFISNQDAHMKEFVETRSTDITNLLKTIEQNFSSHIESEKQLFQTDIKESIKTFAQKQYDSSLECLKTSKEALFSKTEELVANQQEIYNEFIETTKTKLVETCNNINDILTSNGNNILEKMDNHHQETIEHFERTINENKKEIEMVMNEIQSYNNSFKTKIETSQNDFMSSLLKNSESYKISLNSICDKIAEAMDKIASQTEKSNTLITNNLCDYQTAVINQCGSLPMEISNKIYESSKFGELESASKEIKKATEEFGDGITAISDNLKQIAAEVQLSTKEYSEATKKYDAINRYILGTENLFKQHTTAIQLLETTLPTIENSINKMRQ